MNVQSFKSGYTDIRTATQSFKGTTYWKRKKNNGNESAAAEAIEIKDWAR